MKKINLYLPLQFLKPTASFAVARCPYFCGRGRVFVAEQCADNWQAQAVNNADRCKRMPQIM
jgi:hypothetical protein